MTQSDGGEDQTIVPYSQALPPVAQNQTVEAYLARIRPEWQATPLVNRVRQLLPVDPSSACQRLLNAAGHDLKSKILMLGLNLAQEAARAYKLPPVENEEALEEYPTARLYDLAYRIGLLSRSDSRRLHRTYEIRRDLEHEDDEYEATLAELLLVFETAIDVVLSREPVQVIHLQDVLDVVESNRLALVPQDLIDDYAAAPPQRQEEIFHSLVFWAIDESRPEIVRANCIRIIRKFSPLTGSPTKITLAKKLEVRVGRKPSDSSSAHAAVISGAFPFIRRQQQRTLVAAMLERFNSVSPDWRSNPEHGELLDDFSDAGGFSACPAGSDRRIIRWMVEAYVGEPGHHGTWGRNRPVFFSDTAVPRIERMLRDAPPQIKGALAVICNDTGIRRLAQTPSQEQRLEALRMLATTPPLESQ